MSKTPRNIRRPIPDEGRKVLYRLLLFAVAVVYALVFVLDYLLQLHFTFFLLLSLFGFVILTLLYMWFRVSGSQELIPEEDSNEKENVEPEENRTKSNAGIPAFPDALFIISTTSGLILDCSEEAMRLFETTDKNTLLGSDLSRFMAEDWSKEEKKQIRRSLDRQGKANAKGSFVSLKGGKFSGMVQMVKNQEPGERSLMLRITETHGDQNYQNINSSNAESVSGQAKDSPMAKYFEEGMQAMALIGMNYKFTRANKAFCDLLGYTEIELQQISFPDIVHPEEKEKERKNLSALFRNEVPLSKREKRLVKRNNDVIWVTSHSTTVLDELGRPQFIITMVENITQKKRIERTLYDRKEKLNALVENAEYSILSVDKHHTILLINSKLSDLLFA
ncbi:MAG TPA: PAS domain S-box protein, partial [Bacteroidia bacterium]|nr:PAS domain S-box protein [Bacteroidia bacterium]